MFYRGPQDYQFLDNCHVFTLLNKGLNLPYLTQRWVVKPEGSTMQNHSPKEGAKLKFFFQEGAWYQALVGVYFLVGKLSH